MKHQLVSPFISHNRHLDQNQGRLNAISLFFDVAGFSTITSALMAEGQQGAEVLSQLMRQIYAPVIDTIYGYGGFITVFAGDAFTALFPEEPVPWLSTVSTESHARRALAAAWSIREKISSLGQIETPTTNFDITVKLGIGAGSVEWGIIAAQDKNRATYYFRGAAVDDCAQSEKFCSGNDLVISPAAQDVLGEYVLGKPIKDHFEVAEITAALPPPQVVTLPEISTAQQTIFYPKEVFDQSSSGEFRRAISVFVNFQGNPTGKQLHTLVQHVLSLQAIYGGLLNRIDFGDKGCSILLFWGAPISYENDAERALSFLLALQDESGLPIRAGVTQRIAHTGFLGSDLHEEYTCNGNGINMAARLMVNAPWESIWVDQPIAERVTNQFDVEKEGNYPFKGFAEPQPVYVLLGRKKFDTTNFFAGKMVGRDRENAELTDFIRPIISPEITTRFAGALLITGEAGLGKSRLIHDFQIDLEKKHSNLENKISESPQWFLCQTDQLLQQPLNPFQYWLKNYFDQSREQTDARNKRNFSRKLHQLTTAINDLDLIAEIERTTSFLGSLVDLYWENSLYEQIDSELRFTNLVSALKTLLLAESRRRPVVVFLEDIHWLDDTSQNFIKQLVRNISAYPIAIIATARDSISANWLLQLTGVSVHNLKLHPLGPSGLKKLAKNILGGTLDEKTLQMLHQRSGGNPFFAEQLLKFMLDEKLIIRDGSSWVPDPDAFEAQLVPGSVRHIFTVRLDSLKREVRELVQTAAVLGREFNVPVLQRMANHTEDLPSLLMAAENADVWTGLSPSQYIFRNMLLRDVAYDMQVQTNRRELHLLAAQTLEDLYIQDLAAFYGQIAYHYETSQRQGALEATQKAFNYLQLAGQQAAKNHENQAAIDYFSRALALIPADSIQERFDLTLAREQAYQWEGEREAQEKDIGILKNLGAELSDPILQAQVELRHSQFGLETANFPLAIKAAQSALEFAQAAGGFGQEAAARRLWGDVLWRQGNFLEAKDQLEAALLAARTAGDRQIEAKAMRTLGIVNYFVAENPQVAENDFLNSLTISREIGDRMGEGANLGNLGQLYGELGQFDTAFGYLEEAEKCLREIGFRFGQLHTYANVARLSILLGNIPEAIRYVEDGMELSRDIGEPSQEAHLLVVRSVILRQQGDKSGSRDQAAEALRLARTANSWEIERMAILALGRIQSRLGDFEAAEATLKDGISKIAENEDRTFMVFFLAGLAEVYAEIGRWDDAQNIVVDIIHRMADGKTQRALEGIAYLFLVSYRIMKARNHPQRQDIILSGYSALMAEANLIRDENARASYLGNVPENRALLDLVAQSFPQDIPAPTDELIKIFPRSAENLVDRIIRFGDDAPIIIEAPMNDNQAEFSNTVSSPSPATSESSADGIEPVQMPTTIALEPTPDSMPPDLSGAGLVGAILNRFSLAGWQMRGADLREAQLRAADLRHVNFEGADLRDANLRAADLSGANLANADLRGAALDGAKLANVSYNEKTRWPAGFLVAEL
jgi:predicted ATPase/class 3 adenylate cyclase